MRSEVTKATQWFQLYLYGIQATVFLSKDGDNVIHAT